MKNVFHAVKKAYRAVTDTIENPVFMRKFNGWATIFWIIMIPISLATGWVGMVVYVSALSLWALVSGHWAAWQAARVEVKQQEQEDAEDEKLQRMIEEIVRRVNDITPDK